jgi:ribonuclease P protein component
MRYLIASTDGPALGFAISKRVGGSVVRNRIRRRLRAAVAAANAPLTSGFYLISADASAATAPFHELEAAVANVFARVDSAASA